SPPTPASRRSLSVGAARARSTKTRMAVSGWLRRQSVDYRDDWCNVPGRLMAVAGEVRSLALTMPHLVGTGLARDATTSPLRHHSATPGAKMMHSTALSSLKKCHDPGKTGKNLVFVSGTTLAYCHGKKAFLRSRLPYSQTLAGRWWPLQLD